MQMLHTEIRASGLPPMQTKSELERNPCTWYVFFQTGKTGSVSQTAPIEDVISSKTSADDEL
jgi:hypothetical protein